MTYHIVIYCRDAQFPDGCRTLPRRGETGTGGRIRDVQATGQGGLVLAGTAGYCTGNLLIPGYELPSEDPGPAYPSNLAPSLDMEIEASNGASDYGNKFGEPVCGRLHVVLWTRSSPEASDGDGSKKLMFTGGLGQINDRHVGEG